MIALRAPPSLGLYDIKASFTAAATGGPSIYILHNGSKIAERNNLKQNKPLNFSSESIDMGPGDTIEVVVGVGSHKVFYSDETIFTLTISEH